MFPPLLLFLYKFHLSASCSLQCVLALNDAAHVQSWAGPGFLSVKSHGNLATSDGSEVQGQISHTWPWLGLVEPWGLVYYKWRACLNLLLLFTYTELPNSTASFDLTGVQAGLGPCGSSSASQVLGLPVCTSGWPPTSVFQFHRCVWGSSLMLTAAVTKAVSHVTRLLFLQRLSVWWCGTR